MILKFKSLNNVIKLHTLKIILLYASLATRMQLDLYCTVVERNASSDQCHIMLSNTRRDVLLFLHCYFRLTSMCVHGNGSAHGNGIPMDSHSRGSVKSHYNASLFAAFTQRSIA